MWISGHCIVNNGANFCINLKVMCNPHRQDPNALHTKELWHQHSWCWSTSPTVYPKKYAHGFCFAVLCCGYTLTDFPISIRITSLALWQSNDCPSASKATLMNMDKYFMWIHYEWLRNHNKAKHNKTVCIFLGIYCIMQGQYRAMTNPNSNVNGTNMGPTWGRQDPGGSYVGHMNLAI